MGANLHKLNCLVMLASLALILLSALANISFGLEIPSTSDTTLTTLNINGATLEGKYLLGIVKGDEKSNENNVAKPAWTLATHRISVYRANFLQGNMTITAKANGNTGSELAKSQGDAPVYISIGSICTDLGDCRRGSDPQESKGSLSEEPKVSGYFNWDYDQMGWAGFPFTISGLKSSSPVGIHDIASYILILPQETTLNMPGDAGSGKDDPKLIDTLWKTSMKDGITVGVWGLSPFAVLKSIELDGRALTKVPYQEKSSFSTPNDNSVGIPLVEVVPPPPGSWTAKDRMSPSDLTLDSQWGFLFVPVMDFLKSSIGGSAVISYPSDFRTGYHEVTVVAEPFSSGSEVDSQLYGITGSEGKRLTAKFLLFNPNFTLDRNRLSPGDAFNVIGSGFAPVSRVKVYAEYGDQEVSLGDAATDSSGGFNEQFNLPAASYDWFQYMWIGTGNESIGRIKVRIDDADFQARYSSSDYPEIIKGVEQTITYIKPGTTQALNPTQVPTNQAGLNPPIPASTGTPAYNPNPGQGLNQGNSQSSGGCYQDPRTGTITCVDSNGNPINTQSGSETNQFGPSSSNPEGNVQRGCYKDPVTGTITCVDSNGNPINTQSGSKTIQGGNGKPPSSTIETPQGGCHTDPSTGVVTCVDTLGDFSSPEVSNQGSSGQGGCYKDPITGTITCVDSNGNAINTQSGSKMNQPGPGLSVPRSLDECETYTSEICGTWTLQGSHINAVWNNGAKATMNVEQFDNNAVVITRQDTEGSSAGLTARYEGRPIGNHVDGSVTWNWNGSTWGGTWKADW